MKQYTLKFEEFKKYTVVRPYKTLVMPNGQKKYRIFFDNKNRNYWATSTEKALKICYNDLISYNIIKEVA